MRTIEEIKEAYRERATSEYAKVRTSMTGEDLATVFDHIATLEAQNAALQARVDALGEWEKLSESPWLFKEETEFPVEMLVVVPALYIPDADDCKAHYEPNFFDDSGIEVLGWRALPLPPSE